MQNFYIEHNLMDNRALILSKMKQKPSTVTPINQSPVNPSPVVNPSTSDGADDGKISFKEKLKNFGIGLIKPIKSIFSSPKNFIKAAGAVALGAGLIAITGGAAAPVMVAAGLVGGAIQIGKGIYKQATAKTDEQARNAWQDMGSGTFAVGASALSAKAALKASGTNTQNVSAFGAAVKCIKGLPKNISNAFSTAKFNVSNFINSLRLLKYKNSQVIIDGDFVEISSGNNTAAITKNTSSSGNSNTASLVAKSNNTSKNIINSNSESVVPAKNSANAGRFTPFYKNRLKNYSNLFNGFVRKFWYKNNPLNKKYGFKYPQIEAKPAPLQIEMKNSPVKSNGNGFKFTLNKGGIVNKVKEFFNVFGLFLKKKD